MRPKGKFAVTALLRLMTLSSCAAAAVGEVPVAPMFSPPGGVYTPAQTVKITDATPGVTIYFTTNGEAPTTKSAKYTAALVVSESETLRAIAVASGGAQSAATSDTYHLLASVLHRLDAAAANFKSTSANVEFDNVDTEPIYTKDVDKGVVYYQRKGSGFQMAAHLSEENGRPVPKVYVYSGGTVKLYEKLTNQVTTLSKFAQYQSWFELGFGASGKDLAEKWDIEYLGAETIDGAKTEKLELVPKDPAIKKNLPKVTVWMDVDHAVSIKQVFDEGQGKSHTAIFSNIKVNQSLPSDAFTFKTDPNPTYVNR